MPDGARFAASEDPFAPVLSLSPARARRRMCRGAREAVGRLRGADGNAPAARRAVGGGGAAAAPNRGAGGEARRSGGAFAAAVGSRDSRALLSAGHSAHRSPPSLEDDQAGLRTQAAPRLGKPGGAGPAP